MENRAVVIGAGIAGLAAAQVLSRRYAGVTVLDRDTLPDAAAPRRGVPQSAQPHILLASGYLALGDAICSFNPIYGQGMTCAAREATALGAALDRHDRTPTPEMARDFYAATAEVVATPWRFAVGGDFGYPETTGPRPRGIAARNWYAAGSPWHPRSRRRSTGSSSASSS